MFFQSSKTGSSCLAWNTLHFLITLRGKYMRTKLFVVHPDCSRTFCLFSQITRSVKRILSVPRLFHDLSGICQHSPDDEDAKPDTLRTVHQHGQSVLIETDGKTLVHICCANCAVACAGACACACFVLVLILIQTNGKTLLHLCLC